MCLGNISKDFTVDSMKKTGLYGYVYYFSVYYDCIDINDILDIHKYLMKKHNTKQCLDLLRKMFIGLLSACTTPCLSFRGSLASDAIKCT